jgi:hypothetical protein
VNAGEENDDATSARQPYSSEARRRWLIARSGPREGFRRLGDSVQAWWRESGLARRGREGAIHDAIHAALGAEYGRHARVVKFTRGTAVVEVSSAAHHAELNAFAGQGIAAAANQLLGDQRIHKIVYKRKG